MKTITIMQPFATLITIGVKHYEMRNWATKYRGDLLIHAGKGEEYLILCDKEPFKSILKHFGYKNLYNLPRGFIISKVTLEDCIKVKRSDMCINNSAILENGVKIGKDEYAFGDYTEGRYAWKLANIQKFKEPIPTKGQQRMWNYRGEI